MILSFADQETSDIYHGNPSKKARKRIHNVLWEKEQMKLDMLKRAKRLEDLKVPPNNKLEKLEGTLPGRYSIRINDQHRIVFQWEQSGVSQVDFVKHLGGSWTQPKLSAILNGKRSITRNFS